jgi:hypothetical protein
MANDIIAQGHMTDKNAQRGNTLIFPTPHPSSSSIVAYFPDSVYPVGRDGHGMVHINGIIYMFGGRTNSGQTNELWTYNLSTRKWNQLSPGGDTLIGRFGFAMFVHNGDIYVFGGWSGPNANHNTLHRYVISTNTWTLMTVSGSIPVGRHAFAWVYNEVIANLYIFGGHSGTFENTSYRLNLNTLIWTQITNLPVQRAYITAVDQFPLIVMFGGNTGATRSNQLISYDADIDEYNVSTPADGPGPINFHKTVRIGNTMFLVGGETSTGKNPHMYGMDLNSYTWSEPVENVFGANNGRTMPATMIIDIDNFLFYVDGGIIGTSNTRFPELWKINLSPFLITQEKTKRVIVNGNTFEHEGITYSGITNGSNVAVQAVISGTAKSGLSLHQLLLT